METAVQQLLRGILIIASALFGACAGAVVGMAACLILRDGLQFDMPLLRIAVIAGLSGSAGAIVLVLFDRWAMRDARASSSENRSSAAADPSSPRAQGFAEPDGGSDSGLK
jgi:hypothetical protein